jgi:uncharacterized membrane protein YphA (DoxX/SURF4 family)
MKRTKIAYWISTSLVGLMMVYSAYAYLTQPVMQQAFQHIGYPAYFRVELAIAKLIGVVLLLAPVASRIKEWVYAGFTIVFVSAFIAHVSSGDPAGVWMAPLIFLAVLAVSYLTYHKSQQESQSINFQHKHA